MPTTLKTRLTAFARRWWPVPALAAAQLGAGVALGRPTDVQYYRSLRQAPFAPPAWAFGPAWTVAKAGVSTAVVRGARTVQGPDRARLAALAAVDSAIFTSFTHVYFTRRSPELAAVWTVADAAVTATAVPLLHRHDKKAAWALAPQAAWLCLAVPVALWQVAANRDELRRRRADRRTVEGPTGR